MSEACFVDKNMKEGGQGVYERDVKKAQYFRHSRAFATLNLFYLFA